MPVIDFGRLLGATRSGPWRTLVFGGLILLLPALACRRAIVTGLMHRPQTCEAFNQLMIHDGIGAYNRAALSLNYFEHGLIRRGLGGTLLQLFGSSPMAGCVDRLLLFHMFSAIWVAVPLALLVRRAIRDDAYYGLWLAFLLVVSPQLFLAWGGDLGRIDMFVEGCLAWSVLALMRGSLWAVIASLLFGLLAHENTIIYGIPLLAAMFLRTPGRSNSRATLLLAAVLVGGIVLIVLAQSAFTTASSQEIVNSVLRSQAPSNKRDFAAYIAVSGARGIATSLCRSLGRPATPFYLASALALIALYAWLFRLRFRDKILYYYAIVTVLPFIAVSMVAVDYGRWVTYAVLNGWLFAAATADPEERAHPPHRWAMPLRVIVLGVLVAMRPTHVHLPTFFVKTLAERLWSPKATLIRPTDTCDPSWRTSIGLPLNPDYPPPKRN
jgi:hypothetical protein